MLLGVGRLHCLFQNCCLGVSATSEGRLPSVADSNSAPLRSPLFQSRLAELPDKKSLADRLSWPERKFRPLAELQKIAGSLERVSGNGILTCVLCPVPGPGSGTLTCVVCVRCGQVRLTADLCRVCSVCPGERGAAGSLHAAAAAAVGRTAALPGADCARRLGSAARQRTGRVGPRATHRTAAGQSGPPPHTHTPDSSRSVPAPSTYPGQQQVSPPHTEQQRVFVSGSVSVPLCL